MTLTSEEKRNIIRYRIERSRQAMKEARDNATLGNWNLTANRLYYATFYMAIAAILSHGETARSHNGVFNLFSKSYIATGIVDKEAGILYRRLFSMRQSGDYDDLFDWTEDDVAPLLDKTQTLIDSIAKLIAF